MKLSSRKLLTSVLFFALAAPLALMAEDIPAGAWAGIWVATSKSKFPGPSPKLDQVTIDPDGKAAIHVESPDGKITDWSYKPQVGNHRRA